MEPWPLTVSMVLPPRLWGNSVSFQQAIVSLIIMFVIQWIYTLVSLGAAIILYFYIGQVSPGLPLGECFFSPYY